MDVAQLPLRGSTRTASIDAELLYKPLTAFCCGGLVTMTIGERKWRLSKGDASPFSYVTTHATVSVGNCRKQVNVSLHRLVMQAGQGQIIDHIDRDRLNNCCGNLRFATWSINALNRKNPGRKIAPYRGIGWALRGEIWGAWISVGNKLVCLGTSRDAMQAGRLYDAGARMAYGENATLNFPDLPPVDLKPKNLAKLLGRINEIKLPAEAAQ